MPDNSILDIITVPDFTAERSMLFEYRTLFFLASWIETAHLQTRCQLHLACIGNPPESVKYLAKQAHANITIHEPYTIEGFAMFNSNKFRGFEVTGDAARILLIDTDIFLWAA